MGEGGSEGVNRFNSFIHSRAPQLKVDQIKPIRTIRLEPLKIGRFLLMIFGYIYLRRLMSEWNEEFKTKNVDILVLFPRIKF